MYERQTLLRNPIAGPLIALVAATFAWTVYQEGFQAWPHPLLIALILVFGSAQLRTRLDGSALRITYWPFWSRRIELADIESVEATTYRGLGDFMGWGIRFGLRGRLQGIIAYTVWGSQGILVRTSRGRDTLIGTRQVDAWVEALRDEGVKVV